MIPCFTSLAESGTGDKCKTPAIAEDSMSPESAIIFSKFVFRGTIDRGGGIIAGKEIRLVVPVDALPPKRSVEIELQACLSGPFNIPDNVILITPVFRITPHLDFHREVTLTLTHFANIESWKDCEDIVLITSPSEFDAHTKQWTFSESRIRPKCIPGEMEATVNLTHFCFMALVRRVVRGEDYV